MILSLYVLSASAETRISIFEWQIANKDFSVIAKSTLLDEKCEFEVKVIEKYNGMDMNRFENWIAF